MDNPYRPTPNRLSSKWLVALAIAAGVAGYDQYSNQTLSNLAEPWLARLNWSHHNVSLSMASMKANHEADTQKEQLINALQAQLAERSALVIENRALRQENQSLRLMAHLPVTDEFFPVAMRAFDFSSLGNRQTYTLDARQVKWLRAQPAKQVVISEKGLIGLTEGSEEPFWSLQLLTDAKANIPVQNDRTGQRVIAKGTGHDTLTLRHVAKSSDLKVGDTLSTSGIAGQYPSDIPVGVVSTVEPDAADQFLQVSITPFVSQETLQWVSVVSPDRIQSLETQAIPTPVLSVPTPVDDSDLIPTTFIEPADALEAPTETLMDGFDEPVYEDTVEPAFSQDEVAEELSVSHPVRADEPEAIATRPAKPAHKEPSVAINHSAPPHPVVQAIEPTKTTVQPRPQRAAPVDDWVLPPVESRGGGVQRKLTTPASIESTAVVDEISVPEAVSLDTTDSSLFEAWWENDPAFTEEASVEVGTQLPRFEALTQRTGE